jgi:hypothetical protein
VRFSFFFIEDIEQGKDTEIQRLADVEGMRHESDKNDSLKACIGEDAWNNVTSLPVD